MKKKTSIDPLLDQFYSEGSEKERLSLHRIEKDRTLMILKRHLPPAPATILDVGGASGVYAFPLTKMGYQVHLVDPVALHIEQAEKEAQKSGLRLAGCEVGDARKLSAKDQSVDIVLFLGPLYHLTEEKDRLKALSEAHRVLKPGGILFAAGITRCASFIDAIHKGVLYSKLNIIKEALATGVHRKASNNLAFAYLHYPADLKREIEISGFNEVSLRAIEGPIWDKGIVPTLGEDPEGWKELLTLLENIETDETLIGASPHIMAIGSK